MQRYWISLALWLASNLSFAASDTRLFGDDYANVEPLVIEITGPLSALARDGATTPEVRPGTLKLTEAGTEFQIGLKPRGKSRRKRSNCRFPPLWLEFDKASIKKTVIAGHHRRKLVTQCRALSAVGRDNSKIWLEMLAYRSLNLLTDRSLRVQPVVITYRDTARANKTYQHAGFLLEHKKELAKRLDLSLAETDRVRLSTLDPAHGNLNALFNLLVGNPDFSLTQGSTADDCCHNSIPMHDSDGIVYPIIYDFDNTGLVNPPYATTPDNLTLRNVRQRIYRGYCRHNDQVAASMARLLAARTDLETLYQDHPAISASEKKRVAKYFAAFFKRFSDAKGQQRHLLKACLG